MTSRERKRDGPRWTRSLAVLAPLAVVAAGAVATALAADYEDRVRERDLRQRADLIGDALADELSALLETQIGGAAATAAALSVDPDLDRAAFARYAGGIADQLPTLLGVGYVRRVAATDLDSFVAGARADGAPDFELQDLSTGPEHAILLYNEPTAELRPSWGVDVTSVDEAARALQRATDGGRTAVTEQLVLAVARDVAPAERPVGYVAYAPVFAPGAPTGSVEQRRQAVVGWSNLPFRAQELLDELRLPTGVRVVLRDGEPDRPAIAAAGPVPDGATARTLQPLRSPNAEIGWVLEATAPSSIVQPQLDRSAAAIAAGTSLTALLAVLVGLVARGSTRWAGTAKRATQTLIESEERLRATIDAAPDLLLVVDAAGTIMSASPRARDLLGTDAAALGGEHISQLLPAIHDPASIGDRTEHQVRRNDGSRVVVELAARPLRPEDPASPRVVVVRDVTAQRQARRQLRARSRQLERSNQDLQAIATIAAHDLSEPLTVIGGYADLLVQKYQVGSTVDDAAATHLRTIAGGAQRMRAMLDALLHMSSMETHEPPAPVPLDQVVRDALANTESALRSCDAEVVVGPLPTVVGHRDLLVELMQNLVANAVRHADADDPLRIGIESVRDGARWRITVSDNGSGVPPEQRRRIFQAFRRLDGNRPGLGIGLSIARRIVQLHGGRIKVEDAPDGGAAFTFTLPAVHPDGSTSASEPR